MGEQNGSSGTPAGSRGQQMQRVLDECLRRRATGETLPDDEVLAQHAELMPELGERLAALRLIEQAGQQAEGSSAGVALPAEHVAGHCRHCGAPWRMRAEFAGRRAKCRKCGQAFTVEAEVSDGAPAPAGGPPPAGAPETIPGYQIEGELGQGGMGRVYRARELATKRTVALKVMLAGRYADERQRRRFEREVEIAAALTHPHIARLYASGLHAGHHWFAMEYVEGVPLDTYVEREHPGLADLLGLFARICHAVNHAHQRGIMHRDLKPGNILVDERAQPRVLDFGLAKLTDGLGSADESISMPGEIAGTPAYMSPEQTKGDPSQIDVRSDVYSLGVILYRLLTGQSPYIRSAGPSRPASGGPPSPTPLSLPELLKAINEIEPVPPRCVRKGVPDEVSAIAMNALEKDPPRRYQTAGELARDVEAYLAGDVVTAKRGSGWYTLRKTALRYKRLAGAIAAVVVLSLGLGLTMSALFVKKEIEYRDVVRQVEVIREREAAGQGPATEQEIRGLAEQFYAACRPDPRGDYERFAALLADDVLAAGPYGDRLGGKDALLKWHKNDRPRQSAAFDTYDLTYDVESVRLLGDAAVVFGKAHFGGMLKSGKEGRAANWETLVFRREPAGWRIVHEQSTALQPGLVQAFAALRALREGRPLYVDAKAKGANTGGSWANAYTDLQDALAIALRGHEIWVAAGTYKPAGPGGDRTASFQLNSGVELCGGFAGNETQREQRDPQKNETILSGDLNGDDGPGFANNDENSYHVVVGSGCDSSAILDGFRIARGNANGEGADDGGGLFSKGGSPTIRNCMFIGNTAGDDGGGIGAFGGANVTLLACAFVGNTAGSGGGGLFNEDGNPTLANCAFSGNRASEGGAVWNSGRSNPTLANCTFSANLAKQGAGICNSGAVNAGVTNCILWGKSEQKPGPRLLQVDGGHSEVNYSCVQDSTDGLGGNIAQDPLFVDADGPDNIAGTEDDDLRLKPNSPCIDAGDAAALPADGADLDGDGDTTEPIPLDLGGNARVVSDAVDMGAYEVGDDVAEKTCPADDIQAVEKKLLAKWEKRQSVSVRANVLMQREMGPVKLTGKGHGAYDALRRDDKWLQRAEIRFKVEMRRDDPEGKVTERSSDVQRTIIVDGQYEYEIEEQNGQKKATKKKAEPSDVDPFACPVVDAVFAKLHKDEYELTLLPDEMLGGASMYVIEAKSGANADVTKRGRLYLRQDDGTIAKAVEYMDGKPYAAMTFIEMRLDVEFQPQHFTFTAPEGVEVEDRTGADTEKPGARKP